ncbi:MAG TPA: hypothetical protein VEC17_02595 [Candidatus Binatia bacterium]|nr:hypothetical protein [Candidatus Binatia bacterium]
MAIDQIPVEYLESFQHPVEADFFKPEQVSQLKQEEQKLEATKGYVSSRVNEEDLEDELQKAAVEGKIYSPSEFQVIKAKLLAYEGEGERTDTQETIISPSGQRVIMGIRLQNVLGYDGDGFMTKEESDQLISALQADSVPSPEIDKVNAAMNKYRVILLQRGVFTELKDMLEEALGKKLTVVRGDFVPKSTPQFAQHQELPKQELPELPPSFVEYLKTVDTEYNLLEKEVIADPKFIEFFSNLRKHYAYYQNLPAEKMVGELLIRPALWVKLSEPTQIKLQSLVQRNLAGFQTKVSKVASESHVEKLDDLKKNMVK